MRSHSVQSTGSRAPLGHGFFSLRGFFARSFPSSSSTPLRAPRCFFAHLGGGGGSRGMLRTTLIVASHRLVLASLYGFVPIGGGSTLQASSPLVGLCDSFFFLIIHEVLDERASGGPATPCVSFHLCSAHRYRTAPSR